MVRKTYQDGIEDAAKVADAYADENIRMAGDTVLIDPCLKGKGFSDANVALSEKLQSQGLIHSSMHHAATNIAAAIRAIPSPSPKD